MIINTRLALGTGAVPIEPMVAMIIRRMYDAAVTSSPFRIPKLIKTNEARERERGERDWNQEDFLGGLFLCLFVLFFNLPSQILAHTK